MSIDVNTAEEIFFARVKVNAMQSKDSFLVKTALVSNIMFLLRIAPFMTDFLLCFL